MVEEVCSLLAPKTGYIVDATLGGGGHAEAILSRGSETTLVGFDADPSAIEFCQVRLARFGSRAILHHENFAHLEAVLRAHGQYPIAGALFDLGVSRHQLTSDKRGFTYEGTGPLDMRFDSREMKTARTIISSSSEAGLREILRHFGEEPRAARLARAIRGERTNLHTTRDLADLVRAEVPARFAHKTLARTFQALRIATNDELSSLEKGLAGALNLLAAEGRVVTLAYHSLEDRIVKQTFRAETGQGRIELLVRKPLRPSAAEVKRNPSARSARLRAARRR